MIIQKTLTSYKVRFSQHPNITVRATIYCYSADKKTELLISFDDREVEAMPRIDNLPEGNVRIVVQYPTNMLQFVQHILQTERPINVYASNNNNYTQVHFGTSDVEPIGEEE